MKSAMILIVVLILAASGVLAADGGVRTITVQGRAKIEVAPDEAVLNLGVESFDADLDAAKLNNDRIVSAVLSVARESGVSDDDLRTDRLFIHPRYNETGGERNLQGYLVHQSIVIIIDDTDKVESMLSAVLAAGVNRVHGIEYRTSNPGFHRDRARSMALDAAKEKASAMAAQLGQDVGRPLEIREQPGSSARPNPFNVSTHGGRAVGAPEGTMVAGRIAVTATVSVKFELLE